METASAISAPATDAGQTSDQDSTPTGNSAGDSQSSQRQDRGAESQSPKKPAVKAKPAEDDDPEWDLGSGRKAKRSEVQKRLSDTQRGAQKAWEEHKKSAERLTARDAKLKELGVDVDEFEKDPRAAFRKAAQQQLAAELEEATRDPRDLAAEREKKRADDLQAKIDAQAEETRKTEHQKQVDAHADEIADHFATALEKHGLPNNPKAVWMMASLLQGARRAGQRISLSELAHRSNELINGDLDHYLPAADGAALAKRLGPQRLEALRQHMLAEHEQKFKPQPTRSPAPRIVTSSDHPSGYITPDQYRAQRKR